MKLAALAMMSAAALTALAGCSGTRRSFQNRFALVRAESICADQSFTIYFDEGSDGLTSQARQLIRETARQYQACAIRTVRVVGLADSTGTPEANLSLSQRRARRVAHALGLAHFPAPAFEVSAAGEQGATLSGGREEPVRRRAEVFLTVAPRPN